jgi:Protein of unknown function (DUF998)
MFKPQNLLNAAVLACFIGPAIMVTADVLTIILNHRFDLVEQTISGFAVGPYGWLEKIGIMMIAVCFLLMGLVLLNVNKAKNLQLLKTAGILFLIAAAGFLFTALINTTFVTVIAGIHFSFHKLSLVIGSVAFYQACLIFTGLMISKPGLKASGIYGGFVYLVGLVTFLWVVFSFHYIAYSGLAERILTGVNLIWIILIGPRVIKMAGAPIPENHPTGVLQSSLEYNQIETGDESPVSRVEVQGDAPEKEKQSTY